MGIIFEVVTQNKSDILKILIEILQNAEKEGVEIYEEDDSSFNKD